MLVGTLGRTRYVLLVFACALGSTTRHFLRPYAVSQYRDASLMLKNRYLYTLSFIF